MEKTENTNLDADLKHDLIHKLEIKEEQLNEVSLVSSSLDIETTLNSPVLTQGEQTTATVKVENTGSLTVKHIELALAAPNSWDVDGSKDISKLEPGETETLEFNLTVPEEATLYHPYDEPVVQTNVSLKERGATYENTLYIDDDDAGVPEVNKLTHMSIV